MQNASLWRGLLGVEKTVVEDIEFDEDERSWSRMSGRGEHAAGRCGRCGRRCRATTVARADGGGGRWIWARSGSGWRPTHRGWAAPSMGSWWPRCRGPGMAPDTRCVFDEQVAWLATQCSKSAVTELMRIAWRTVGAIITRVWADVEPCTTGWTGYPDRDR